MTVEETWARANGTNGGLMCQMQTFHGFKPRGRHKLPDSVPVKLESGSFLFMFRFVLRRAYELGASK